MCSGNRGLKDKIMKGKIEMKIIRLVSIVLIVLQILCISSSVFAVDDAKIGDSVLLKAEQNLDYIGVNYWGQDLTIYYTLYNNKYPAYCVEYYKGGITTDREYSVEVVENYIDENFTDSTENNKKLTVWRVIKNGYPYKQIQGLNEYESYAATKLAVFYVLENWEASGDVGDKVTATNEEGQKVINAMYNIVEIAKSSKEVPEAPNLTLIHSEWAIDEIDNRFLSKKITLDSSTQISEFNIDLEGNVPNGTFITDLENNKITQFKNCKEFKILLPLDYLITEGEFTINAQVKVPSYPLLFGASSIKDLQSYVLTGETTKIKPENLPISYPQNKTKLIIKKKDENDNALSQVKFNLLNSNKEIVYENIETNESGFIEINNLIPGLYYLQEIETIEGYELSSELIEVNIDLDEEKEIIVENKKIPEEPETPKLPRTGW